MLEILLFAQSANGGVELLQTVVNGGAALILAVVASVLGYFAYHQLKQNSDLERSFRQKIEIDANARLEGSEKLLREMLERDREAQEGISATVAIVENFTQAMKDQQLACSTVENVVREQVLKFDSLIERIRSIEDEMRRRS